MKGVTEREVRAARPNTGATTTNTTKLGTTSVPTTPDGRLHARATLRTLGLKDHGAWDFIAAEHRVGAGTYDFGDGPEPVITTEQYGTLAFALDTPEARRAQQRAQRLLSAWVAGDVHTAAEIAERNPDGQARRWLSARMESTEARKRFMQTVARHGGNGDIYRQVSSVSNRSVLSMNSAALRRERGVRGTRDGMSAAELMRLTYLETASAQALEAHAAHGNEQILELHRANAENERRVWDAALGRAS